MNCTLRVGASQHLWSTPKKKFLQVRRWNHLPLILLRSSGASLAMIESIDHTFAELVKMRCGDKIFQRRVGQSKNLDTYENGFLHVR